MPKGIFLRKRTPMLERFWARVKKTDTCWIWTGSKSSFGHGFIGKPGQNSGHVTTHRYSWEIHFGQIPAGVCVCHHCDNPSCVNPDHLFLGTQADNMHDMLQKGRRVQPPQNGEHNGNAKLTLNDVRAIQSMAGMATQQKIGEIFGISQAHVSHIIKGTRFWKET